LVAALLGDGGGETTTTTTTDQGMLRPIDDLARSTPHDNICAWLWSRKNICWKSHMCQYSLFLL
jgi:hypothetical protein